jgi:hypothetical protein
MAVEKKMALANYVVWTEERQRSMVAIRADSEEFQTDARLA